jgi:hypothetical protein
MSDTESVFTSQPRYDVNDEGVTSFPREEVAWRHTRSQQGFNPGVQVVLGPRDIIVTSTTYVERSRSAEVLYSTICMMRDHVL